MPTLAKKYWVFALRQHLCGVVHDDPALKVLSEMYDMRDRDEKTGYYYLLERSGLSVWYPYENPFLNEPDNIDNVLDSISAMAQGLSLLEGDPSEPWDPHANS